MSDFDSRARKAADSVGSRLPRTLTTPRKAYGARIDHPPAQLFRARLLPQQYSSPASQSRYPHRRSRDTVECGWRGVRVVGSVEAVRHM